MTVFILTAFFCSAFHLCMLHKAFFDATFPCHPLLCIQSLPAQSRVALCVLRKFWCASFSFSDMQSLWSPLPACFPLPPKSLEDYVSPRHFASALPLLCTLYSLALDFWRYKNFKESPDNVSMSIHFPVGAGALSGLEFWYGKAILCYWLHVVFIRNSSFNP